MTIVFLTVGFACIGAGVATILLRNKLRTQVSPFPWERWWVERWYGDYDEFTRISLLFKGIAFTLIGIVCLITGIDRGLPYGLGLAGRIFVSGLIFGLIVISILYFFAVYRMRR